MAAFSTDWKLNFSGGADYTVLEVDTFFFFRDIYIYTEILHIFVFTHKPLCCSCPVSAPAMFYKTSGVYSSRLAVHKEDF